MNTNDIVSRLWNLCNVLRDDGVTYHQYVTELTYLLFLKMTAETGTESQIPAGYRWADLEDLEGVAQLNFYRALLVHLGTAGSTRVKAIFANANTVIKQPKNLGTLVKSIDDLDWYSIEREQLGDLYEGLLEKNAAEKKSGAGQYFTPRPLIETMVRVTQPRAGELVQDPACGTGGFLIAHGPPRGGVLGGGESVSPEEQRDMGATSGGRVSRARCGASRPVGFGTRHASDRTAPHMQPRSPTR